MNDFKREHEKRKSWRDFKNALNQVRQHGVLHCPVCFHTYDLEELGKPHSEVHCIECLGQGKVQIMRNIEDLDQSEWYEEFID